MTDRVRIVASGDAAWLIEFEERIDPVVNARVIGLAERIRAELIPGVVDVVPAFRSLVVYVDAPKTDQRLLRERLGELAAVSTAPAVRPRAPRSVPVCYGGEWGPDLDAVADFAGLPAAGVIECHASTAYRVFMLGFSPGFAYLGPVDRRIAMPRLATPRTKVRAGSVAIAGTQTGIYPIDTPGGWRVIGRTPVRPFDFSRADPFMFRAGDQIRFRPVSRDEYDGLLHKGCEA